MFALCLGVPASLIRLPRCYYYTTCKWCMESHLSSDAGVLLALVPCAVCAACVAAGCVRGPGLAVPLWPGAVGLCFALLPGGVALLCLPCSLGLYVDLVHGPLISPCYMAYLRPCIPGLIWASEKRLYFRPNFSAMYFPDIFYGFYFPAFFLALFSRRYLASSFFSM